MNLTQAVSLCASVVAGNNGAPFGPHVGLSRDWVTGASPGMRVSVDCATGIDGRVWVGAKGLLDVLAKLGPDATLSLKPGGILHVSVGGKVKVKMAGHGEGPTYESPTSSKRVSVAAADLRRALGAVVHASIETAGAPWMRGVNFVDGHVWATMGHRAAMSPLPGIVRMAPLPIESARTVLRALETEPTAEVAINVTERDAEFVIGAVRLRSPLLAEEAPPHAFGQAQSTNGEPGKVAHVKRDALVAAVKVAGLSRSVTTWTKERGEPGIRLSIVDGRMVASSADSAEDECDATGEMDAIGIAPRYLMDALASLGEDIEIVTRGELGPVTMRSGDEVRIVMPMRMS